MREEKEHYYKRAYIYIISQDPKTLKSDKEYYKVGLTNDNILRRLSDYQTCYREFLVHGLFEFQVKDVKAAETAIHKQLPDMIFYRKYVEAGTEYPEMVREKTRSGYVTTKVGTLTAHKDMLVDDFKKKTEWVSCSLGEIYHAIKTVLDTNPALNSITGYKMNATTIKELTAYNMKQIDDSMYYSHVSNAYHKKVNATTLQYHKGNFYDVIVDKNAKVTKRKIDSTKFPVVVVDGTHLNGGFDFWPARVQKSLSTYEGRQYEVYYFAENTMDHVYPSQTKSFTQAVYKALSKTANQNLQKALNDAYEYQYDAKPPKAKK
jgi:hypothetical protein